MACRGGKSKCAGLTIVLDDANHPRVATVSSTKAVDLRSGAIMVSGPLPDGFCGHTIPISVAQTSGRPKLDTEVTYVSWSTLALDHVGWSYLHSHHPPDLP